ncbi:ABC transporter ATP-binding protein [Pelagibacterium lacus]|uniref:ABC transporter ATP-binding protein n=2 Tax=Pelagibacterium lacus TaxID=2282655 RepID=A0A369W4C1_9HYPH|nr:ABC transporter ATP-binding protein [Pelagibacterium lacus]RDE09546.1 ABC transporter ATP-binding protein [Pelagibacterium lacus]
MLHTPDTDSFISIKHVSKSFGPVQALSDIGLDIKSGEFVSIVGPSGCGKSTLLMLLSGLMKRTGGDIRVGGQMVDSPRSDIGIVFQRDVLMEWRSALRNVLLQAEVRGMPMGPAAARARELLKMVSLDAFENAYPHQLSGGMRQRVSICRALLHKPPLLVMDEPFGALDALTRDQMQLDLLRICRETHTTVLFITHSISEAIFLSDRVVVMSPRPGRIERIIDIDLPRPRRLSIRESREFATYSDEVTQIFKSLGVLREGDDE